MEYEWKIDIQWYLVIVEEEKMEQGCSARQRECNWRDCDEIRRSDEVDLHPSLIKLVDILNRHE